MAVENLATKTMQFYANPCHKYGRGAAQGVVKTGVVVLGSEIGAGEAVTTTVRVVDASTADGGDVECTM